MKVCKALAGKMDSRLPKPTGIKKPNINKTVLPTERLKANAACILKDMGIQRPPLTKDLSNLTAISTAGPVRKRARSPDIVRPQTSSRAKLRRSRSVCDVREMAARPLLQKFDSTKLPPIPAKFGKFNFSGSSSSLYNSSTAIQSSTTKHSSRPARVTKPPMVSKNSSAALSKPNVTEKNSASTSKAVLKRIPAYDFKARFNDLLEKHKTLKQKHDEAKEQLAAIDNLPEQYEQCESDLTACKADLRNAKTEIECLQRQNNSQNIKIESLTKCLRETKEKLEKFMEKCEFLTKEQTCMSSELTELRQSCSELTETVGVLTTDLGECRDQLFRSNMERKELHNAVMDLRGNIRVFCRVRPPLRQELDRMSCGWNYLDETSLEIQNLEVLASGSKNKVASHEFRFDHVFHPKSSQEDVFEMVSPLIQSALDGYNICIFAYGQTGSGKTYTMDGVPNNVGVIPRTVDLLFDAIRNYKRLGWEYEIRATFLEIYNEVLYDLLSNEQKEMEIRMAKNKSDIYVSNITEEVVVSADHLRQLMNIAKMNRATAATIGNERSSRSHAVTRIELIGTHIVKNETSIGTINLVDLAGSESPKTSLRMNETKNINRSLSELTNVILALLQKQDHIPYRNSKLTHLLMPSLGGNSKTLMFINVAPFQDCFVESVKSLRFAASVNSCKMTKAKKNKFLNTSIDTEK